MSRGPSESPVDRRALLRGTGALCVTAVAGCVSAVRDSSDDGYERETLSDPPEGTPGELYYAVEERVEGYDLQVESLYENDGDLILAYHSDAEHALESEGADSEVSTDDDDSGTDDGGDDDSGTDDGGDDDSGTDGDDDEVQTAAAREDDPVYMRTMEEVGAITDIFNETLMKHGDGDEYGMLIGEIENPLEDQPHGWGAKTEWFERYNAGEMSEMDLMMSISGLVVYEDQIDEVS